MPLARMTLRARVRSVGAVALGAAVALLGAGCGSSSSSSSSVAVANAAGSTSANVSQAEAMVADASRRPSSISVTLPIGKPSPTGKKIVFISCGVAQCVLHGKIVAQTAALLGWTSSTVATDGSPAQIQDETAVRQGVDAIVTTAASRAESRPRSLSWKPRGS